LSQGAAPNLLSRGRRDDPEHLGDADPVRIDPRYGRCPPWHDLQLELHGPPVLWRATAAKLQAWHDGASRAPGRPAGPGPIGWSWPGC
jgi:hypothetical protein